MLKSALGSSRSALQALLKTFIVMKLAIFIILLTAFQVKANPGFGQTVNLSVNQTEIKKVLKAIEKDGQVRFLFNSNLKDLGKKVNFSVSNLDIRESLNILFNGSNLTYKILEDNLIVVLSLNEEENKDITVTGRVTNEAGEGISLASIVIKGTKTGTTTDANGSFTITVPDNAVLIFSAVGYTTQELSVGGTVMNVKLAASTQKLDEVVVVGYGTQRRKAVTGAISRVSGSELAKQPLLTPIQGIQGLAPGIQVVGSSEPGSQPRVVIRGLNTIITNENPWYVVDGVLTQDIKNLNNADVASVDVLKDGAAAIYGSRASNGIVAITTKKGKSGKPNVTFDAFIGTRKWINKVKMANRQQYLAYTHDALYFDSLANPTGVDTTYLRTLDGTANTNWLDEITQSAALQNYVISMNGGNDNVTYLFSAGYMSDRGLLKGANYERYTLRLNNEYRLSKAVKLGNIITASIVGSSNKSNGEFTTAYRASPAAPIKDNTGNWGYQPGLSAAGNPVANLALTNNFSKDLRLQGSLFGELTLVKGLTFRSAWGFDNNNFNNQTYNPVYGYGTFVNNTSELFLTENRRFNWIWDNVLSYRKKFGGIHNIELMAGHTAEKDRFRNLQIRGTDIPPDRNLWYFQQGNPDVSFIASGSGGRLIQRASIYGRVNYSLKDRYHLNAVLRRDGSSAFPTNQKYGTFYAVGASWVISEENFMSNIKGIDFLKLRAGISELGNDDISRAIPNELLAAGSVGIANTDPYGGGGTAYSGITRVIKPNDFASWETTKSIDIGLEFGLLARRLTGEFSYYNKLANAYIYAKAPTFIDLDGSFLAQAADIRNKGFEFALNWNDNLNKNFGYRIGINLTRNTNVVEKVDATIDIKDGGLGNGEVTTSTVAGQPVGSFWLYETQGIFQTQAEIDASPHIQGTIPGDFRFKDVNNDGVINDKDRQYFGSYQPKFYYGFNLGFNWKALDFSVDCYGNAGNKVYNGKKAVRFGNENIEAIRDTRWTPTNPSNTEYRASNAIPKPSTYFLESGSFFRVNNVTLGYTLPSKITEKAYIGRARVFVSAQNPIISKKFSGFSPELPGSSALNSGIELNVYPTTATYMFGVNITFK
jgi:TonB-dependent starch-binding outer membrane protein SusC